MTVERVKGLRAHGGRLEIRCWSGPAYGRDFFQEIDDGLGLAGEDSGGGDVGERSQHKASLGDSWMRKGQLWQGEGEVVVVENVEVDRARGMVAVI